MSGQPFSLGVSCHACLRTAWEGNELPAGKDAEALLAEFAGPEGVPCPGRNDQCPHKPAALLVRENSRAATVGELKALQDRIDELEGRKP